MNTKLKKILKITLPLALGVFLIWYSIYSATPDERQILWTAITNAEIEWVVLSVFLGMLSHISRAYRWQFLLDTIGSRTTFYNRFFAVMIGYLANMGVPRSGEILRGATLTTYEKVPFEKSFGTIVSERLVDFVMLLLITGIAFIWQFDLLYTYFDEKNINPFTSITVLVALLLIGILILKLLKKANHNLLIKIKSFAEGLLDGIKSALLMKKKWSFLFHTLAIWILYILMIYVSKYAVSGTENLSFQAILATFVAGSFAMTVTNGGIGLYPIAIGAILLLFDIQQATGEALGWIIWGSQTLLILFLGSLSFILLPVLNKAK
ncbi:lysylphosphatidylglycerol synthase transmembrane domain-containing protein [Aquimarina sp. 2-A2]|uniref:lysylphosphatidylglycerol synthase transmembrane domain-containing protein n=1 Tax=Aquimarina sp. 2-A2 TaxID=3382644 RepID=UPI00387F0097